jgi:LuxR family transcriptional regulator, maltose regulon positive regulatory protein
VAASRRPGRHHLTLALRGQGPQLERLLTQVPRAVLLSRPELATGLAATRAAQGVASEVGELVAVARARVGELSARRGDRVRVQLDVVTGAHARLMGDFTAAAAAYRRVPLDPAVLARLGMSDSAIVPVVVLANLGTAELWTGDLPAAEEHLRAAADTRGAPALPHINAAGHLALLQARDDATRSAAPYGCSEHHEHASGGSRHLRG